MQERNNKLLKSVDRYLGPIVILLLSIFIDNRKKVHLSAQPDIAIIKTGALGDALLVGPVIKQIKKTIPGSRILFICTKSNVQAVRGLEGVDSIFIFDVKNPLISFYNLKKLGVYDLVLDFASWARLNVIISGFMNARCRMGFKTDGMHRHYIYDLVTSHSSKVHELDNYRNLLTALKMEGCLLAPAFNVDYKATGLEGGAVSGKFIVFHPFPGGSLKFLKSWPWEQWITLGKKIAALGYRIIITGGPDDREAAERMAREIGCDHAVSRAGQFDFNQTAYVIMKSESLVSVDTGVMHLGAAVGANVISLHGPTSPERWGAKGTRVTAITRRLPCSPCISLGFESKCKNPECMQRITVDEVLTQIQNLKGEKSKC